MTTQQRIALWLAGIALLCGIAGAILWTTADTSANDHNTSVSAEAADISRYMSGYDVTGFHEATPDHTPSTILWVIGGAALVAAFFVPLITPPKGQPTQ